MKKLLTGFIVFMSLLSCNSGGNDKTDATENAVENNPKAIDSTTQHPSGMSNSSVISTDTNAMDVNIQTDANKKDEGKEKK